MTLRIAGGRVIDPANGIDDEVRDVWIADGGSSPRRPIPEARADRTIDARGYVVMPGGVDMHCHIAGPKVNAARMLRPEDKREPSGRAAARRTPLGDAGERAEHVRHRLPVRRARLHDGRRRRHPPAGRPPRPSRVPRHAGHRQGVPRPAWGTITT